MFAIILELKNKTKAHTAEVNREPSLCEVGLLIPHVHELNALEGQHRKHLEGTRSANSVITK